jgi:hypothetical protein
LQPRQEQRRQIHRGSPIAQLCVITGLDPVIHASPLEARGWPDQVKIKSGHDDYRWS